MTLQQVCGLVLAIALSSHVTFAQDSADQNSNGRALPPPSRPRMSAEELLGDRPVTGSLDELVPILAPGYEIVVWDAAGQKTRGRVSSITGTQVTVHQRSGSPLLRLFRPPRNRVLPADSVVRIDIVDSTRNGTLIGVAVAPVLVYGIWRWEDATVQNPDEKGWATLLFGPISAILAIRIGQSIDLSRNRPIYERPPGGPRVTFAPVFEPTRKGVVAHVRF